MPKDTKFPRRVKKTVKIVVLSLFIIAALIFLRLVDHNKTYINATTHQPVQYTELYFTNPQDLPQIASSNQTIPLSFTLHNVENENMTYTYEIEFTNTSGQTRQLVSKSVYIPNGKRSHVVNKIVLPKFSDRGEISVLVLHQSEAIHLWVTAVS